MRSRRRTLCSLGLALALIAACATSGRSTSPKAAVVGALVDVALAAGATAVERRVAARRRARARDDSGELEPAPRSLADELELGESAELPGQGARSPLLPLYPEGLAVAVAPEDITCDVDLDCVVLHAADCCDCAEGGVVVAVRADRAEALRALRDCVGATCAPADPSPSCLAEPVCRHGLCRLLPPESIPPPPPSPATGPIEVPPGYE